MTFKLPKLPSFNLKLDSRIIIGIAILALFVGSTLAFTMEPLEPVGAAWEVGGNLNHQRMYSRTSDGWQYFYPDDTDLAYGSYVTNVDSQIKMDDGSRPDGTAPPGRGPDGVLYLEPTWTEAQCPDSSLYLFGSSRIDTHVDNLVPVGRDEETGKWRKVEDGTLHKYYTKTENATGITYGFAHFVFLQVVQAKTAGVAGSILGKPVGTCQGLPYWDWTGVAHGVNLRIFVEVNLQPWTIVDGQICQVNGSSYEINDPFMGVMSVSVFPNDAVSASLIDTSELPLEDGGVPGIYAGTAPGSPTGTGEDIDVYLGGVVQPSKVPGGALPMWIENVTTTVTKGVPDEDDVIGRSNSTVYRNIVYEVGGEMEPGLAINANYWPGDILVGWHTWTPVQNLMYYVVRIDVVTSFGVTLIAGDPDAATPWVGYEPPPVDLTPMERFWLNLGAAGEFWFDNLQDLAESASFPLVMLAIVVVCALIFYLILKLGLIRRGMGG
jgi:hypothetical protein